MLNSDANNPAQQRYTEPGKVNVEVQTEEDISNTTQITILKNNNRPIHQPKLKIIKPIHERIKEYKAAKRRIFNSDQKVGKMRTKKKQRKTEIKDMNACMITTSKNDVRPYATFRIQEKELNGLLDSGATLNFLGRGCKELVEELKLQIKPISSSVRTADGGRHDVLGKVTVEVVFKETTKQQTFYLCPALSLPVILGVPFWKIFEIAPELFNQPECAALEVSETSLEETDYLIQKHNFSEAEEKRLDAAIKTFATFEDFGLGKTDIERHAIKIVPEAKPVKHKLQMVSPVVLSALAEEVDRMLRLGVIEECQGSEWLSRTVLVKKPGKNRLCLDSRDVNKVTVKDTFPIPNIDGHLQNLKASRYIASIDLKDAYWQVVLDEESRDKTAFTIPGRPLYQFKRMPFGLCNAAQRMCRLMDKIIPQQLRHRVFVYLDDLLVIGNDFDEFVDTIVKVANHLKEAKLTINADKSKFGFKYLKYLGFIVGDGKLQVDPDKVAAIQNFPVPKTPRMVRSFMGMAGWYRRFVPEFATMSAPITDSLKKGTKFKFTQEAVEAFKKLKDAMSSAPVLINPDFTKHFFIQCDASNRGIGAVLFQKDEEGYEHPIYFHSQKLNSAQCNYTVTEKECLAVVTAIQKFRPYVEGMPFTVITDHASLKWLMTLKDLSGRLARWSLKLQAFDFSIEHRKGSLNKVPDALSRVFCEAVEDFEDLPILGFETTEFESEEYKELLKTVEDNKEQLPDLKIIDGFVYKKTLFNRTSTELNEFVWKLWIPASLTSALIAEAHEPPTKSHGGIHKTLHRLRQLYYWPNMAAQVRSYIANCEACKGAKPNTQGSKPPMGGEMTTERPFQRLYIDFLGPYVRSKTGNTYIFIVLDHFSKFVFLKPMNKANSKNVIKFLIGEIFHKFGVPESIVSDNGKQFVSKHFADMAEKYSIKHLRTPIYAPQANASERVNQSVLAAIRTYLQNDQRDWDINITEIECALRSAVHAATGVSPYFALFGQNMIIHGSTYKLARQLQTLSDSEVQLLPKNLRLELLRSKIKENLHAAYEKGAKVYNTRTKEVRFIPGQEVFRKNFVQSDFSRNINAKLCPKFIKCRIIKGYNNNRYDVEDLNGKFIGNYHAKYLRP